MLRHKIVIATAISSLVLVFAPVANAQDIPCEQPAFGLFHAEAAKSGVLGSGGHIPGQEHLGFSSCIRP